MVKAVACNIKAVVSEIALICTMNRHEATSCHGSKWVKIIRKAVDTITVITI